MNPKRSPSGFTLIEVLIALVILAIGFGSSMAAIRSYLNRQRQDRAEMTATMYARTLLARVGTDIALTDGRSDGYDRPFAWSINIVPWVATTIASSDATRLPLQAHKVSVQVTWSGASDRQAITLTTLRLVRSP